MSYGWPDCKHATYTEGQLANRQERYSAPFTYQIHAQTQVPLQLALWWRNGGGSLRNRPSWPEEQPTEAPFRGAAFVFGPNKSHWWRLWQTGKTVSPSAAQDGSSGARQQLGGAVRPRF